MAEETILLNVQIDQSDAQKQLVQTEKNILNLKKQQAELNKEYKAGKISQDDYAEANLKLQQSIKKETDQKRTLLKLVDTESNSRNALKLRVAEATREYDNLNKKTAEGAKRADDLQKELSQLNAEITKSSKSAGLFKDQIGNYPDQFSKIGASISKATDEVQPFGLSVGGATASLSKFASPAGAILGIVTGLATAYSMSAEGARDLEFAQGLLASATDILANKVGDFISNEGEAEIGLWSRLTGGLLAYLDVTLASQSAIKAAAIQRQKDLEISRALAAAAAKDDERRAENARRIRDDESKALSERLEQTEAIDQTLERSRLRSEIVIRAQINAIKEATTNYERNRQAQLEVAQLEAEIADKNEEINGKLTENVVARRNILKLIEEERKLTAADDRAQRRAIDFVENEIPKLENNPRETQEEAAQAAATKALIEGGQVRIDANKAINDSLLKENKEFYEKDLAFKRQSAALKQRVDEAQLASAAAISAAAASLFDQQSSEYKIFATAQTLISTYAAATKAYEAAFVPPTLASPAIGAAYAAAAIAQGLANVAAINGVQFAEGGILQGPSHAQGGIPFSVGGQLGFEAEGGEALINKRSTAMFLPQLSAINQAGGGVPFERGGLTRYNDGGFVSQQNISPYQMAMITANAIKGMPAPVVSWREGQNVGKRVEWRESVSKR